LRPSSTDDSVPYSLFLRHREMGSIRMEIAETALQSPSRAGRTASSDALASLSGGFRWFKQ
jgi:hypothetical protein